MVKSKVTGTVLTAQTDFLNDVQKIVRAYVEKTLIPQIQEDVRKLMAKTTRHWDGGRAGSQGDRTYYPPPKPDFEPTEVELDVTENGIALKFNVDFTAKAGGQVSKLWYILDFGRPDGTWDASYPSAWFLPQSSHRTIPNSLEVNANRAYIHTSHEDGWLSNTGKIKAEDGLIYIRKMPGDALAGIPATNWSKLIAEEIQRTYRKSGLKITFTRKKPV